MFITRASFKIAIESDTHIILLDLNDGRSLANDIVGVTARLNHSLPNGIGGRRVYYRDGNGQFHEIVTRRGQFADLKSCTASQQQRLTAMIAAA